MNKFTSGRWIFTVIAALAFLYCVISKSFNAEQTKEIVMIIIVFYFQKNRPDGTTKQP